MAAGRWGHLGAAGVLHGAFQVAQRVERRATSDMEPTFVARHRAVRRFTLASVERNYALYEAVRYLCEAGVKGDVVETGVWRGGSAMLACLALLDAGDDARRVWLYDTFTGMTPAGDRDRGWRLGRFSVDPHRPNPLFDWVVGGMSVGRDEVRRNLARTGFPPERTVLVPGRVEDTLPAQAPERVALLRLDTGWYAGIHHALRVLYPRVPAGGVVVVDDYGVLEGTRRAVEDCLAELGQRLLFHRVDASCRMGVKVAL